MKVQSLNGAWQLTHIETGKHYAGQVPGCVHLDLEREKAIPDPFYRDHESDLFWIGESDWSYQRSFTVPADLLEQPQVRLRADGLDTLATVKINGQEVGKADNMFRVWEWDVKRLLKAGENTIEVYFDSPVRYATERQNEHFLWHTGIDQHKHRISGGNWLRKELCSFGWDWGPMMPSSGIWRSIQIVGYASRILHLLTRQEHHADGSATLFVKPAIEAEGEHTVEASLSLDGQEVVTAQLENGQETALRVEKPELWWPNGLGEQTLYDLAVTLKSGGEDQDRTTRQIGLRRLELIREKDDVGESFCFAANGVRFFAKGANWIPADSFDGRITRETLQDLLQSAADANMNCVRVWGGGKYESDDFYEICDQLGLCVWQDFMFACSAYPAHLKSFMDNVRIEAEENVRRLHHHASMVLWCGNNELEHLYGFIGDTPGTMSWHHYCALFDDLLAEVCAELCPDIAYWPSSEHSPIGDRMKPASGDARWGDAHLWSVWHGKQPFEWYRTALHRFCSEFGFQSFPEPKTIETFTNEEDRNLTSFVMEKHQRSPNGNELIFHYMLSWFQVPASFEQQVWLSQILQVLGIQYAVEHWRRNMPRCMGALYWQLNDCWPIASWASIDYFHRWKALHYAARRFFDPVMLSTVEDAEKGSFELFVSNDLREDFSGQINWMVTTPEGEQLREGVVPASAAAGTSNCVGTVELKDLLDQYGPRGLLVFARLDKGEGATSESLVLFERPKHMNFRDPELSLEAKIEGDEIVATVSAKRPALWAWLTHPDADFRWSDNFFHLAAGETRTLRAKLPPEGQVDPQKLSVSSLWQTYQA
ncbi:MAG: beta-mannosidase [Puniceicoccaceae bacterium 5H]|nr:MAG: beta-mannosidase [Puniceicoccaceae bacterium 5H]